MDFPQSIKTGFDNVNESSISNEMLIKINAILFTFLEKSIELGVFYSKSSGRNNLSSTDMLYATQYQTLEFINIKPEQFSANEQNVNLLTSDSDSDSDSDSESVSDSDSGDSNDPTSSEYFCRSNENNPIISKMNECHDNWSTWFPEDPIQILLKTAVDNNFNSLNSTC